MNNPLNFGDDPSYDPDPDYDPDRTDLHETFTRCVSRTNEQSSVHKISLLANTDIF